MADIDVVKKSSNTWLWLILALVVIALVAWFVMGGRRTTQTGLLRMNVVPSSSAATLAYNA
jgi:lipopolysaccharide export system protein LptC